MRCDSMSQRGGAVTQPNDFRPLRGISYALGKSAQLI